MICTIDFIIECKRKEGSETVILCLFSNTTQIFSISNTAEVYVTLKVILKCAFGTCF